MNPTPQPPFISLNSWSDADTLIQGIAPSEVITGGPGDWHRISETLQRYQADAPDADANPCGGLAGYFTYEGDFWFGIFPEFKTRSRDFTNPVWSGLKSRANFDSPPSTRPTSDSADQNQTTSAVDWRSNFTQDEFESAVETAREYIRAGDIYQVNLAQEFRRAFSGNPYGLFEQLTWRSPAPGSAFIDTGERQILCSSPELFLRIDGRHIVTRPIKGTRPRDRDPIRDAQLAYELQTCPKEQAELVMITDLERNDLGQICSYGSVRVSELLKLEAYPQVYHLVSTVEGELRDNVSTVDAVRACFPGGSITGAPKKRAREIIAELERGPRGIYTGAIGWLGFNGDAAFNITIRTMILEKGELRFHVGSGITADSHPTREYEETLHKASGLRLAVEAYIADNRHPAHRSGVVARQARK